MVHYPDIIVTWGFDINLYNVLVRVSAKEITSLILDEERLRSERKDRKSWKSRVTGIEDYASSSNAPPNRPESERRRPHRTSGGRNRTDEQEDLEYRLAIEASKNQAEEDKRKNANKLTDVDDDLAKAIKLSKEEEELRQRELEQSNADRLFDDASPTPTTQTFQQPTYQQQSEYQQLGQVDFFGNPVGQQSTGYLANVYSQPTGYPQQQYAQPTGFDQSGQMPYNMVTQPTGFTANPYIAPVSLSPQPTQQSFLQPGDNNPYASNHQVTQPLQPLPTGSNNPFAPKINNFSNQSQSTGMPSLGLLQQQQEQQRQQQQEQQRQQQLLHQQEQRQQQLQQQQQLFQNQPYQNSFASSSPTPAPSKTPANPQHAHLEGLLAAGNASGLDTFGNVGDLRIPAQHTAPGMFVNSAGTSRTGRPMAAQATGNNPFFNQQFTGAPQSSGFGASLSPAPNRLMPAHTGPAGLNGFGGYQQQQAMGGSPYGGGFGQQQQPQQQQNGNLIDL